MRREDYFTEDGRKIPFNDLKGGEILRSGSGILKVDNESVSLCLSRSSQTCPECTEKDSCPIKISQ